jgi:hypothetical protein
LTDDVTLNKSLVDGVVISSFSQTSWTREAGIYPALIILSTSRSICIAVSVIQLAHNLC